MFNKLKEYFFPKKDKIENYFTKTYKKDVCKTIKNCEGNCGESFYCTDCGLRDKCSWIQKDIIFDKNKDSILIIDDNSGLVSFLRDDIETICIENGVDINSLNILEFSSKYAAYTFIATHRYFGSLNIKYAIIDITFGGSVQTHTGNVRLTGVDVFEEIYKTEGESLKFIFYTGNQLNPYIKSNQKLMEQFNEIYHDSILHHVIYKTSLSMDKRRDAINNILFKGVK
jgi:hypothetical protein